MIQAHATEETRDLFSGELVPAYLNAPLEILLRAVLEAKRHVEAAFAEIPGQQRESIASDAGAWLEIPFATGKAKEPGLAGAKLRESLPRVHWERVAAAALTLLEGALAAGPLFETHRPEAEAIVDRVSLTLQFDFGTVILGGYGNDVHTGPATLIVDPGGDDVYRARVASAIGPGRPVALLLDGSGNDTYVTTESFTQGAAALGVALLVDQGGRDSYCAGSYSQGASVLGFSGLLDLGDDRDDYRAESFVQGAALGGVGWLRSEGGDDRSERLSQSFSRQRAAAALLDRAGDDVYLGGDLSQGATVMDSLAILLDAEGRDLYHLPSGARGQPYAELEGDQDLPALPGEVRHLGIAILLDVAGTDRFTGPLARAPFYLGSPHSGGYDVSAGEVRK